MRQLVERRARIVRHHVHLVLSDHVAAEVFLEVDCGLEGHAEITSVVVGVEELVAIMNVVDVSPAATALPPAPADDLVDVYHDQRDGGRFWIVDDRWGMTELNLVKRRWRSWTG